MKHLIKSLRRLWQMRSGLSLLIIAAVLIEATALVQYWFASRGIREEAQHRAEAEMQITSQQIKTVLTAVEVPIGNMVWAIERHLSQPDSLYAMARRIIEQNPTIVGCGVAFVADYYPEKGRWFEPYVAKRPDGSIEELQIGSASHNYLQTDWFLRGLAAEEGCWTEPYYDEAGARMMLCTYSRALRDAQGRVVGVLGADVSLEWLSSVINAHPIYPSSYSLMISREGQIMACPVESLVMKRNIMEVTARAGDTTAHHINRRMMEGLSGQSAMTDPNGEKCYVFYAPVGSGTGWSMAVVCSDADMFGNLRMVSLYLLLLTILGLALMGYIIYRSIRSFKHFQLVNAEKERMGRELHIARSIQMGMLPKVRQQGHGHGDVEAHGSLLPAKEVGGDLYDYFLRDEKLFFCIGDVSGKGVPASLVMAVTRSLFRAVSKRETLPGRIVETMNASMTEMNETSMFVTLFVGVLDLPTGLLRYCNAGHCPPLLVGPTVDWLPVESNIPLGLVADWKYVAQETVVSPQTMVFLYTDGLSEAENRTHEQFGPKRLAECLTPTTEESTPADIIARMTAAVEHFVDGAEQSDDLTLLAVKYTKEQLEERLSRSIILSNDVQTVPRLATFVDEVCAIVGLDPATTTNMNLAVEEAVVNVMRYAYPEGTKGSINIEAKANDAHLKFIITDKGRPFDPTTVKDADTSLSAEERPTGGLGIFLVRRLMDSINYEYVRGSNVLTLCKKLK